MSNGRKRNLNIVLPFAAAAAKQVLKSFYLLVIQFVAHAHARSETAEAPVKASLGLFQKELHTNA